jgi:hypothetical protein
MGDTKMNANEQIDELIARLSDWRGTILANIRKIIKTADPEIVEELKWMGTPSDMQKFFYIENLSKCSNKRYNIECSGS